MLLVCRSCSIDTLSEGEIIMFYMVKVFIVKRARMWTSNEKYRYIGVVEIKFYVPMTQRELLVQRKPNLENNLTGQDWVLMKIDCNIFSTQFNLGLNLIPGKLFSAIYLVSFFMNLVLSLTHISICVNLHFESFKFLCFN